MKGEQIGQYHVHEELGRGGMGVVYRAYDSRLHREVALKFIPPGALTTETDRERFRREALALSRVNYPSIATVYAFETDGDRDFLVMEYIDGESLDQRVERGPVPETELIGFALQLAMGLAVAHSRGVVHRDLKPGNLRATPDGRLKILDFGLARVLAHEVLSAEDTRLTNSLSLTGTPAYIAPEVIRAQPADARSDIYSAGVVLYELATGTRPFTGLSIGAILEAILTGHPEAPRARNRALSPELEAVILRCLQARPEDRYPNAEALADDLRKLQLLPRHERAATPLSRWLRPRFVLGATAIIAVAIIAGKCRPPADPASRSIAVLPLRSLSGDSVHNYVADGMTEELISQLAGVRSLRVTSFTSVKRIDPSWDITRIASELGVRNVIEGSVRRSGAQLRTSVRLYNASAEQPIWNADYDGDTTDVLGLQSRVANAIVREIRVKLTPEERTRLTAERRVDPDAHRFYLRGRYYWNRRDPGSLRLAMENFERAIATDSLYAEAHAGLADVWTTYGLYGNVRPTEAREHAYAATMRAIALDPELSDAHTSLGTILHNFDWDWAGADREYRRAIELQPSNALPHHHRAHLMAQLGRFDEARREIAAAQAIDPLTIAIAIGSASIEYMSRNNKRALRELDRATEIDSTSVLLHRLSAGVFDQLGRESDAVHELARSFELRGQPEVGAAIRQTYRAQGVRGPLELLIGALIRKRASGAYEPAEHIAELYARLGRKDDAFLWLETAYREKDTELNRLKVDPLFDPLRTDARFGDLLRRMKLDEPGLPS